MISKDCQKSVSHKLATGFLRRARSLRTKLSPKVGNKGYCTICSEEVFFRIEGEWLRDQYRCSGCHSIPRWRALMAMIEILYPDWRMLKIHESSPGGPLSEKLGRECAEYLPTHFFPGVELGTIHEGYRTEDLACQTFPDESFDLVITSDVLEHLPEARKSMIEVARTLKKGGAHIFTVPWYKESQTVVRAKLVEGEVVHLESPEYHGNPVSEDGSLVFTEWGREFPAYLADWVTLPVSVFHLKDRKRGLDGEFIEVFSFGKVAS